MTTADMGRYALISGHDAHGHQFEIRRVGSHVTGYDHNYVQFTAPRAVASTQVAAR